MEPKSTPCMLYHLQPKCCGLERLLIKNGNLHAYQATTNWVEYHTSHFLTSYHGHGGNSLTVLVCPSRAHGVGGLLPM